MGIKQTPFVLDLIEYYLSNLVSINLAHGSGHWDIDNLLSNKILRVSLPSGQNLG